MGVEKRVLDRLKKIPRYLVPFIKKGRVPGVRKKHAAEIYATDHDRWRLFAEGCLRNRYFHEEVFMRGPKCLPCDRRFNKKEASVASKIEKHHADYLRVCIGPLLPNDHEDIYRPAVKGEIDQVPDCRRCHEENFDYFEGCLKRIYPVHGFCHGRIHDKERHFVKKAQAKLKDDFYQAARSWVPTDFYLD